MSPQPRLRRSQRGKRPTYKVGDVVEVVRVDGIVTGRLLKKTDEADASNSARWLVALEDKSEEEGIIEKSLGRVLDETELAQRRVLEEMESESGKSSGGSNSGKQRVNKAKPTITKRAVRNGRVNTRSSGNKAVGTLLGSEPKLRSGKRFGPSQSEKIIKRKNEEVVKVKMLTGTLYLYRGDHPRAEFVRTV
uniref:Uncharacterized protein n=1 Tax=Helicotheca tamesis TaxID=374047 RepID=A0A7S2N576_9STRA|eukprot:CAMPEP_0185732752 /NCGR_PEP_ID=MMETSP1171-20130828/17372_1 /TAXON_ID=374046 /ORGANISM="Helicotheca tamensis, Strain CCMP826" /LENGTH=191 /DNA_ID=CAMNT_0028402321 /DNA_START=16 /DNA_END=591 /DNA_ORIENTATION=-